MAVAYAVTINKVTVFGDQRVVYATLTSNAGGTYTAGGDVITPAQLGLAYIDFVNANEAFIGGYMSAGSNTAYEVDIVPGAGENANAHVVLKESTTGAPNAIVEVVGGSSITTGTTISIQAFGV